MTTDHRSRAAAAQPRQVIERYGRGVRWFHAGTYVTVLVLLVTGLWLLAGREGDPSLLARLTQTSDTSLHRWVGWASTGLVALGVVVGIRSAAAFVVESLRFRRPDGQWFLRWPQAVFTGRFAPHDGHFDPGQRVVNVLLTLGLIALIGSGAAMATLHGGPMFGFLVRVHKWATYLVTPLILGHILLACGILPGYRGVWRSMHLGGRLRTEVAGRLWPGWLERARRDSDGDTEADR